MAISVAIIGLAGSTFSELLREAPLNDARISQDGLVDNSGVVTLAAANNGDLAGFIAALTTAIAQHRHFDRRVDQVPA